jgi:hypothetical protein
MSARKRPVDAAAPPAPFPATASDRIVCAKSVIQAVVAAHDAEAMEGKNYDIHYPLSLVVELLEQAMEQVSAFEDREGRS